MNEIFYWLESVTLLGIFRWLMLLFLLVYTIFAYLIVRQARVMTRAVSMKDDYVIRAAAAAHFVMAILVLVLAIVML